MYFSTLSVDSKILVYIPNVSLNSESHDNVKCIALNSNLKNAVIVSIESC